jgi:hypothetical protein
MPTRDHQKVQAESAKTSAEARYQQISFTLDSKFRPIAAERLTAYHPLSGQAPNLPEAT